MTTKRKPLQSYLHLLQEIGNDLTQDEVESVKNFLRQKGGVGLRRLENCTGRQCLQLMEQLDLLSETNTEHLKELLTEIKRYDLVEKIPKEPSTLKKFKTDCWYQPRLHPVYYFIETKFCRELQHLMKEKNMAMLYGLPGSGKSQLALWFADEFRLEHDESRVLSFECQSEDSLLISMNNLPWDLNLNVLKLINEKSKYIDTLGELICEKIQENRNSANYLLVFDDIQDSTFGLVEKFFNLPWFKGKDGVQEKHKQLKLIATTLHADLKFNERDDCKICLTGMTKEEVISYFKRDTDNVRETEILQLAEKVGYLPLFLVTAKTYMEVTHISAGKYMELLCSKTFVRIGEARIPNGYNKSSMKAIDIVLSKLQMGLSKEAYSVLTFVPFLEHENVPVSILENLLPNSWSHASRQIEVNQLITQIQKYCFGEIRGTNECRMISFHAASSLALELRLEQGEEVVKVKKLLHIFMYQLKVGIRRWSTLKSNVLLLIHATKVLHAAEKLLDNCDFEVMVSKCYINCALGASYRLQGVEDFLAHNFQTEARRLCFQIAGMESVTGNVIDVDNEEATKQFYNGLVQAGKHRLTANFVQTFIESRFRNNEDIAYFCKKGGFDMEDFPDNLMKTYVYDSLCFQGLAVPIDKLKEYFLVELSLYIIYNNARDLYRLNKQSMSMTDKVDDSSETKRAATPTRERFDSCKEQIQAKHRYKREFQFAYKLNQLLKAYYTNSLTYQGTLVERLGLLYVHLREITLNPLRREEEIHTVLDIIQKTQGILEDERLHFEFGVVAMAKDYKNHHVGTCLRHLLKQYKILHSLQEDREKRKECYKEGLIHANRLQALTGELSDCNALPRVHIQLAKYYILEPNPCNLRQAEDQLNKAKTIECEQKGIVLSHCMLQIQIQLIQCLNLKENIDSWKNALELCTTFIEQLKGTNKEKYQVKAKELLKTIQSKLQFRDKFHQH